MIIKLLTAPVCMDVTPNWTAQFNIHVTNMFTTICRQTQMTHLHAPEQEQTTMI